jgi:hypothetical protein
LPRSQGLHDARPPHALDRHGAKRRLAMTVFFHVIASRSRAAKQSRATPRMRDVWLWIATPPKRRLAMTTDITSKTPEMQTHHA